VSHAWLVDPLARTLEVLSFEAGHWTQRGKHEGEAKVRLAAFDSLELELEKLWI